MAHRTQEPYELPYAMTCDAAKVENGVSLELVKKYIKKHKVMLPRYEYLSDLYRGFLRVYGEDPKEEWKPDNRLAVNFPRYMTETFTGYGYGIPIKESSSEDAVNEKMQEFARSNELSDHEAELAKLCCIYGHAWEYVYQDEETQTKLTAFAPTEVFAVYDDTVKGRALFAVRYGYHTIDEKKGVIYGEVMTADRIYRFDNDRIVEDIPNVYGYIPVVEWRLNDERIGLYESVAVLIEAFSHTLGEKANDVDAFAEAYLAILGSEVDDEGIRRIRDDRVINVYGTDDAKEIIVQFLTKPTADSTQENLLERLEKLIYETSMVANISDETFGSSSSGVSLAYKLQAMSNLAKTFDRKIEKSLRKRYKIWASLSTNTNDMNAWADMEFSFSRNIPNNLAEEAEIAKTLEGMVAKDTQLSVLSIINDPQAEMEKMESEAQASREKAMAAFESVPEVEVTETIEE